MSTLIEGRKEGRMDRKELGPSRLFHFSITPATLDINKDVCQEQKNTTNKNAYKKGLPFDIIISQLYQSPRPFGVQLPDFLDVQLPVSCEQQYRRLLIHLLKSSNSSE